MTANAPGELAYANESSFGDTSVTTMTTRIPVFNVDFKPDWKIFPDEAIQARQNESRPGVLGPRSGTLTFSFYMPGGNSVPSSALSEHFAADLLGNALGATSVPNFQQLCTTGSDADTVVVATSGAAFAVGAMFPVGVAGLRGGGRFGVVGSTSSGTTIQSLVALPGSPNSGDQVWDAIQVYLAETGHVSQRFLYQKGATGSAYRLHGCYATNIKISCPVGGVAVCTMTYTCAVVTGPTTVGLPSISTMADCLHTATMNGLLFFQTAGTTTHASTAAISVELELDLGTHPKETLDGAGAYQVITGFERLYCKPRITIKQYWTDTPNTNYALDGASVSFKHILFQNSADAVGRRWGFYMPRAYRVDPEPIFMEHNGAMAIEHSYIGTENVSPNNATDLAKSAIRFAFA